MATFQLIPSPDGKQYDLRKDGRNIDVDIEAQPTDVESALRRARAGSSDTVVVLENGRVVRTLTMRRGRWNF